MEIDAQMEIDAHRVPRSFTSNAGHAARQTAGNNLTLSQMADQKASMLMGATFLVFTLAIGQATKGGHTALPLVVLGGFAFVAACLAVSVVMPSVGTSQAPGHSLNLMFFGDVSQLDEADYLDRVIDNLVDDETMFRMMFRDVWQNAQVLQNKKYRLLGYAYRVFLTGLTASAVTFVVQYSGVHF